MSRTGNIGSTDGISTDLSSKLIKLLRIQRAPRFPLGNSISLEITRSDLNKSLRTFDKYGPNYFVFRPSSGVYCETKSRARPISRLTTGLMLLLAFYAIESKWACFETFWRYRSSTVLTPSITSIGKLTESAINL